MAFCASDISNIRKMGLSFKKIWYALLDWGLLFNTSINSATWVCFKCSLCSYEHDQSLCRLTLNTLKANPPPAKKNKKKLLQLLWINKCLDIHKTPLQPSCTNKNRIIALALAYTNKPHSLQSKARHQSCWKTEDAVPAQSLHLNYSTLLISFHSHICTSFKSCSRMLKKCVLGPFIHTVF